VGDPNVLTGAATPNQLSSQVGRAPGPVVSNRTLAPTPVVLRPGVAVRPTTPLGDTTAPRPRRRLSLSTVIFLGFAAFTVIRFLGQSAGGPGGIQTPTQRPVVESKGPGPIEFGTRQGDCKIEDAATAFEQGTDVRWVAQLSEFQAPDAAVVVLFLRDGSRFNREDVPPDPSVGKWDTLCSADPISESTSGHYILEIWNGDLSKLLARGGYEVKSTP